jgi:transposase InsO family protein
MYVKEFRKEQKRIGTRKLYAMLQDVIKSNHIKIGRDKFFRLLRRNNLLVQRRRRRVFTTNSNHACKKYPNVIWNNIADGPEQIWVSDITYLSTTRGFVYLSLVTDQYSKKIMGYHISSTLEVNGTLEALRMALKNRSHAASKLIHHSDRGLQYCCEEYIRVLEENHIQISMSMKGNPYENAVAERVNGILKTEFNLDRLFKSIAEAETAAEEAISVYNGKRPHSSCDYLTPQQAHERHGILKRHWKNYKPKQQPEYTLSN